MPTMQTMCILHENASCVVTIRADTVFGYDVLLVKEDNPYINQTRNLQAEITDSLRHLPINVNNIGTINPRNIRKQLRVTSYNQWSALPGKDSSTLNTVFAIFKVSFHFCYLHPGAGENLDTVMTEYLHGNIICTSGGDDGSDSDDGCGHGVGDDNNDDDDFDGDDGDYDDEEEKQEEQEEDGDGVNQKMTQFRKVLVITVFAIHLESKHTLL
ncbi:hypothetical protein ANN_26718 [Periplaneta americana]|uniref:Uncharacterized protein n=1 Tax=Periplaneta americana TaxID=6978 RepID=A0ABQ8RZ49_PERAM|nr:hypothetical protein ANN_26718 [Periplaneta americana]